MTYQTLLIDRAQGVATITLNRPEVLNAMSLQLVGELERAIADLESDDGVRALIITGAGEKAFSAGADIHEMRSLSPEESERGMETRYKAQRRIATCAKPIIGAINGLCYGGGTVLATSLDFLVGCERSQFRFLAAAYGQINATWTLPHFLGWPRAKEILYTGRVVSAEEAYRIGLLNHLVTSEALMAKAMELAKAIAASHPGSVQGIKSLIGDNLGRTWEEMWRAEYIGRKTSHKSLPVEEGFKEFIGRKGRDPKKV